MLLSYLTNYAEFFLENIKMYLHKVAEILPQVKQELTYST